MDADITTPQVYDLDAVRRRRAELRESIGALEAALAAPGADRAVVWGERVHDAVQEIADDFAEHMLVTEGADGLHADIQNASPRLSRAVDALAGEHAELAAEIAALVGDTDAPVAVADVPTIRERATRLMGALVRHRQRGADLVYEAFQTDLGAGD
jgi:hypothetical protein